MENCQTRVTQIPPGNWNGMECAHARNNSAPLTSRELGDSEVACERSVSDPVCRYSIDIPIISLIDKPLRPVRWV